VEDGVLHSLHQITSFWEHLDYIESANLQLLAIASSFLRMRELQSLMDSLHAKIR
jgi:hypothetical protein